MTGGQADRRTGGQTVQSGVPTARPSVRPFSANSPAASSWSPAPAALSGGTLRLRVAALAAFLSASSFGHTGFTGTSLWIDPEHRLAIVLLSNRVNPTRNNPRWNPVRGRIADLVMTTLFEDAR